MRMNFGENSHQDTKIHENKILMWEIKPRKI